MPNHGFVLPGLDGRWLDELNLDEIESLLERRAPLLYSMLSTSDDYEAVIALCVTDAASSYLLDDGPLSEEVRHGRRAFLADFLMATFGDVASAIGRRKAHEGAIVATEDDSDRLPQPVPSIEQLQTLGTDLKSNHGDRWEFFLYLMTMCGVRFGEALALRFDSFQRDVDGSWTVHVEESLRDRGHGKGELVKNMTSRVLILPPELARRMFALFGERMGASSAFVFAADGQKEPRPQRVLAMLSSAMSRAGWPEDSFKSPGRALRRAWRACGDSLAESFWPRDDDGTGADPSKD